MNAPVLSRRTFAKGLGGIVLAFSLDPSQMLGQSAAPPLPGSLNGNRLLNAWLRINPDGTATVFTGKVELGQGILTSLAQIAAEELDLPMAKLTMISGDTGRTPNEGQTAGSQSIENSGVALRQAGAQVRALLVELAAGRLGVNAASLSVAEGVIMPTIITAHIRNVRTNSRVVHGAVAGVITMWRPSAAMRKPLMSMLPMCMSAARASTYHHPSAVMTTRAPVTSVLSRVRSV